MAYDQVFTALSVPTRRSIFEALKGRAMSVQELSDLFPVSQPAVSQHLKVLESAGLVEMQRDGVRHVYSARAAGLEELREYLYGFWGDVLDAFANTDEQQGENDE